MDVEVMWKVDIQKEIEGEKGYKDRHKASGFPGSQTQILMKMRTGIFPPTSLVEKNKELPQDFPYGEESRPQS